MEFTDTVELGEPTMTAVPTDTMLSIGLYANDGVTEIDLTDQDYGFGDLHAVRGGRCLHVPSSAFWPWAASLVGLTVVDRRASPRVGILADFDYIEAQAAVSPATTLGLEVQGGPVEDLRRAVLGIDELWAALERLASPS